MKGSFFAEDSPPPAAASAAFEKPRRRSQVSGPRIYYLLAIFDVLTVSASLYLNHRIMRIYLSSVEANQEWAGRLAADVNAPGNDVFDSHDVPLESARMQGALRAFEERRSRRPVPAFRMSRHTVLIVDDEAAIRFGMRGAFSDQAAGAAGPAREARAAPDPVVDTTLTLSEMEGRHIERVLQEERGRVEVAARRLGIPRSSLYQKIKRFGIKVPRA